MKSFQGRAAKWLDECFGLEWRTDRQERLHRFIEEAIELAQAAGASPEEIHALIDYVFERPSHKVAKEVGGVLVTLAGLCEIAGIDMSRAGDDELDSNYSRIDAIREKRRNRRGNSPLPS